MDLPAFLPQELQHLSTVKNDRDLIVRLIQDTESLIIFFEYAADDETWSDRHPIVMKEAIRWMTDRYFDDKLSFEIAQRAAVKIRDHYSILQPHIPHNLTLRVNSTNYEVNSLLWGSSSAFLKNLIRDECRDRRTKVLELRDINPFAFEQIEEFIDTGTVRELWSKTQQEIHPVLKQASEWELTILMEQCQVFLKKYLTFSNVIDNLIEANQFKWLVLKDFCINYINDLEKGVRLDKRGGQAIALEFLSFGEEALRLFEKLRLFITHLICSGSLTKRPEFSQVVQRCPKMICLDISLTESFTDQLKNIPYNIEELEVAKCSWLSNHTLVQFAEICPNLVRMSLSGNIQLNYTAWGLLKNFKNLEKLDVSGCTQLKDEDFNLILQAGRQLTHLNVSNCTGLTENAFFELSRHCLKLSDLDLSRTYISDSGLIELTARCKNIHTLSLSRCLNITEKGVLEALNQSRYLKQLDITKTRLAFDTSHKIKNLYPQLHLIL